MKKILVVEDNELNYKVIEKILMQFNVSLTWVVDGEAFYSKMRKRRAEFDLILMDIMLPDTTGIELSKFIINENYRIPIIVISAYTEMCEEIFELGIKYFIAKPLIKEIFISYIKKYIEIEVLVE